MLSVYDSGQKYPVTGYRDFYITHVEDGNDRLNVTVPVDADIYKRLAEENRVEYGGNYYLIKSIDAPSSYANISCSIDLDFLRANFHRIYDSGSITLPALLLSLLPSGWMVSGYNPGISRTIKMEMATDYDIVKQAANTYSVAYEWHTVGKRLVVLNPNVSEPSGEYLTDELNLRSIAFKGKTDDLVTRLYAYGKDGLTFASINGGREYVENYQYTGKTICGYWQDERYTDATSLKTDAEIMLAGLSAPERSYDCDVIDLAKLDDRYSDFVFALHKVVTLVDRKRHTRMNHKIVEYREYPDEPVRNMLTLSTVIKSIKKQMDSAISEVQESVISNYKTSEKITGLIANALGYYNTVITEPDGSSIAYMHNKPLLTESSIIWKMTSAGFVWSTNGGATWNGGVGADGNAVLKTLEVEGVVADWIKAGTLDASIIKTGTLNADLVRVINLIADHVKSESGRFLMETWAAKFTLKEENRLRTRIYTVRASNNGVPIDEYFGQLQVFSGNVDENGTRGEGARYSFFGPAWVGVGELPDGKTYDGVINAGRIEINTLSTNNGKQIATATENGMKMTPGNFWINDNARFVSYASGAGGILSENNEAGIYGNTARVSGGGSRFDVSADVFQFGNSGSKLLHNYNSLDMHNYSILNSSDARLKTDIHPTDVHALDLLNQIDLQKFRWIENGEHEDIGIIAQQLQEIAPDLVHENPSDGHLSIKTDKLVLYCIKAIQELSGKTESKPLELGLDPHDKWRYTRNAAKRANPKIDDEIVMEVDDDNKPDNATDMG